MKTFRLLAILGLISVGSSVAQEGAKKPNDLIFDTKWGGERISLPPKFAPNMKLKGIEEIRFAPGMFKPDKKDFFTYVFVFSVSEDQKLTDAVIKQEILVYYQGLSGGLMKRKGKDIDVTEFTFEMKKAKAAKGGPKGVKADAITQYSGQLDWIEPFATGEAQVLHFEIQAWHDPAAKKNLLFVCTSPKAIADGDANWKAMRNIRKSFVVNPTK